jgi:glutaredoxin
MYNKYTNKILQYKNKNIYIIFYSPWCKYSIDAINLLKSKGLSFKGYNIDKIKGEIERLLFYLKQEKDIIKFNENHKTRPIIFHNGKFVGGFTDLELYLKNH